MAVAESLIPPSVAASSTLLRPARADALAVRLYFLLLASLGLAAFVLGVRDRLTPDLFPVAPPVELVPPLRDQAWYAVFVLHQQDPLFAACGGTESLAQFKVLYWWEWLRRGSLLLLGAAFVSGAAGAAMLREYRFVLKPLAVIALIGAGYLVALRLLELGAQVEDWARYDVGQYRHALDVTFGSAALALALATAIAPLRQARSSRAGWAWIALIVLDIGSGALFTARDAGTVWRDFPGYEAGAMPPLERLLAYTPLWLNFTFNQYMIQLVHRLLSIGLWSALVANVAWSRRRNHDALGWGAVLLIIATADMVAGIATLWLGAPAVVSLVHEVGAIALLAGAFAAMPLR